MVKATSRWRALAALLRPDSRRWVGLGLLVAFASGLSLAGPLVVRRIVDLASAGTTASAAAHRWRWCISASRSRTQLILVAVSWFATVTAWHTTNQIRMQLAGHVLGLDHEFHRSHTPGELIQRVDGDVTSVSDFLGTGRAQGGGRRRDGASGWWPCWPSSTGGSPSARSST